jgi:hypothetical protein
MGGMLATGALSLQGFLSRHIRTVTMLGSGCFGAGSWHSALKPLLLGLCVLGFPGGFASGLYSRVVGTWASLWPIETLFYWRSNTEVGWGGPLRGARHAAPRPAAFDRFDRRGPQASAARRLAAPRARAANPKPLPAPRPEAGPRAPRQTPNPRARRQAEVGKKLMGNCFRYIPRGLVTQFMESMNAPEGLTTVDGQFRYCDPKVLQHVTTPVLGICGDWDLFCPAPGGLRTVQHFGGQHRRFVFLGPSYGERGAARRWGRARGAFGRAWRWC